MNEPETPLYSVNSPYRRLGRRVLLCRQQCATCHCPKQVQVALSQTSYSVEKLLELPEIYPEIQRLIFAYSEQCSDIVSEPGACEHVDMVRLPKLPLSIDCLDKDL